MQIRFLIILFSVVMAASCVSSKKYKALESESRRQSSQIRSLELAKKKGEKAADDLSQTTKLLRTTESQLADQTAKLSGLQQSYDEIAQSYKEVLDQNKDIIDVTSREKTTLINEINQKQEALDAKEIELDEKLAEIRESERKI